MDSGVPAKFLRSINTNIEKLGLLGVVRDFTVGPKNRVLVAKLARKLTIIMHFYLISVHFVADKGLKTTFESASTTSRMQDLHSHSYGTSSPRFISFFM